MKTTRTFLNSLLVACLAVSCVACSSQSIESPRHTTAPEDMTDQPDSVDKPSDEETITPEAKRIVNLDVSSDGTELDQLEVEPPDDDGMVVFRITAQEPFLARSMDPKLAVGDVVLDDYDYDNSNTTLVYRAHVDSLPERGIISFGWGMGDGNIRGGVAVGYAYERGDHSLTVEAP